MKRAFRPGLSLRNLSAIAHRSSDLLRKLGCRLGGYLPIYHNEILRKSGEFSFHEIAFIGPPALGEMHFEFYFPAPHGLVVDPRDLSGRPVAPVDHQGAQHGAALARQFCRGKPPEPEPERDFSSRAFSRMVSMSWW